MKSQPNLLFLFPDQWRWDWIGALDKIPVRTSNIDRLTREGLLFEQARVNCPLCAPSRAGLATGRRFHRAGVLDNNDELDPSLPNLFQQLKQQGYQVMTTGKSDLHTASECFDPSGWHPYLEKLGFTAAVDYAGKWRGIKLLEKGTPDAYGSYLQEHDLVTNYREDMIARDKQRKDRQQERIATAPSPLPTEASIDAYCGQKSIELLNTASKDKPWFLWVNFPGPHEPFDPPLPYQQHYQDVDFSQPNQPSSEKKEDHQSIRQNYAATIELIDDYVGQLLHTIEERGERENTYIIFASDHGEMLGDHGKWYKQVPYEASVHVPMILAGPGIPKNQRRTAPVELIDLNPTLLDWAGLAPLPDSDGKSLLPLINDSEQTHRDVTISAHADWRMIFDGRYKLCEWKDGTIRLWDLTEDPNETVSCANNPDVQTRLLERLPAESPWFPEEHGFRPV